MTEQQALDIEWDTAVAVLEALVERVESKGER